MSTTIQNLLDEYQSLQLVQKQVSLFEVGSTGYNRSLSILNAELLHISKQKKKEVKIYNKTKEEVKKYYHLFYFREAITGEVFIIATEKIEESNQLLIDKSIYSGCQIQIKSPDFQKQYINDIPVLVTSCNFIKTQFKNIKFNEINLLFTSEFISFRIKSAVEFKYSNVFKSCKGMNTKFSNIYI